MFNPHTTGTNYLPSSFLQSNAELSAQPSQSPYFFSFESERKLQEILNYPYRYYLEVGEHKSLDISLTSLLAQNPDFAICMTTQNAYRALLSHVVASNINQRFGLQDHKSMQIQTCLQEAIINAIIHGNLSIDSDFSSLEGFEAYHSLVDLRLKQEPYKFRRISVTAWDYDSNITIAVTDQGAGYKMAENNVGTDIPHGRGLFLIRTLADRLWVDESQRTTFMSFNYG